MMRERPDASKNEDSKRQCVLMVTLRCNDSRIEYDICLMYSHMKSSTVGTHHVSGYCTNGFRMIEQPSRQNASHLLMPKYARQTQDVASRMMLLADCSREILDNKYTCRNHQASMHAHSCLNSQLQSVATPNSSTNDEL